VILIDGASDNPNGVVSDVDEVTLDICVAGATASGASLVVYIAPPTERGWVDALTAAIHDDINKPSVISISWGWPETSVQDNSTFWTKTGIAAINSLLVEAALLGITVCCSSGDSGSARDTNGIFHVDFPASSPFVLACGGTTIESSKAEVVWNQGPTAASGGGFSSIIPVPTWQSGSVVPANLKEEATGRGIPDVAGFASGYPIPRSNSGRKNLGGTSAVAPLLAGLIARVNQKMGRRIGYINPFLYTRSLGLLSLAFRDIVKGSNRTNVTNRYDASEGWDPCTGWGRPVGLQVMNLLAGEGPGNAAG
jgi:kumamolisin